MLAVELSTFQALPMLCKFCPAVMLTPLFDNIPFVAHSGAGKGKGGADAVADGAGAVVGGAGAGGAGAKPEHPGDPCCRLATERDGPGALFSFHCTVARPGCRQLL